MTISVAHSDTAVHPARGLLPLWVGIGVYALLLAAGNALLNDPDTMWQITVGQWILDHHAVPETDVYSFTMQGQPWISTQWLAQVMFAKAYSIAGWSGPVVLAASAIAVAFAVLARFLSRRANETATLVFVSAALALAVPHMLARPHNGPEPANASVRSAPMPSSIQKRLLARECEISSRCIINSMNPFIPKLRNRRLKVVTMVTIPKSAGVSSRARIITEPICTAKSPPARQSPPLRHEQRFGEVPHPWR